MVDFKNALNIPYNAILPFDPRRYKLAVGSAEYIAIEVIVSKLLRMLVGASRKGWVELATVHAVSLTYMDGAQGFMEPPGSLNADLMTQLQDGAKGIPAVFAAQYITNVANRGFQIPKVSVKEILVTAASKMLSKPLINVMFDKLPKAIKDNFTIQLLMEAKQSAASNLRMN